MSQYADFPTLETARFVLREFVQQDIDAVFRGLSHPQVIAHYGVSYATLDDTQEQMDWFRQIVAEQSGIWWAIADAGTPEVLYGACGFNDRHHEHRHADIGYWLLPEYWGHGVMRECLPAVLDYGFGALALHRVAAEVEPENVRSSALLADLGFVHEGTRRECEFKEGDFLDLADYALLHREWRGSGA
ncbi:GNAT family N-acetyltransferase [Jeongeupia naejangsanensis]|uniref:GNAT family N-acetyltransferase n=1 Tax=Jeongeupia naejangsanensis TaxID=613195 RepID=A0ABS2BIK7_9NEIS|nr:GNAT family protein [Jeongeupia naejangsanensis]MBM3115439.1 GNAT family N-acetyltransferase [Jeongeupia naejangsanensis]